MKNRKKRAQREEVRKILHEMRLQLAAQRLAQESTVPNPNKTDSLQLSDLLVRSGAVRRSVRL